MKIFYFGLIGLLVSSNVLAKPIPFTKGTMVMVDASVGMKEFQAFYAPSYRYSIGGGYLDISDGKEYRHISYIRGNYLAKRWNMDNAQANIFVWGGLGSAQTDKGGGLARNVGFEADYETRRVYVSGKMDLFEGPHFSQRIDTAQLGFAPYKHDIDKLATWVILQQRQTKGGISDGNETAVLLRFFKGKTWVEVGSSLDGRPQAQVMINF